MDKRLIGFLRVIFYLILFVLLNLPISNFEVKLFISDLIHGSHGFEVRDTMGVKLVTFLYFGINSFFIIQTLMYIFIGGALNNRNTSIFRFFKLLISGIREMSQTQNFWTNSSTSVATDQIERVIQYRDNKIALMSNREAVEYMKGTGHIDFMMSRPDLKQNKKVLSYMNGKMAFMDNETAVNFLKGQK